MADHPYIEGESTWENSQKFTKFLYGDSDEIGEFWSAEAPQQETFHYAFYELRLECEVDLNSGEARILSVDGVPLERPLKA